MSLIGGEGYKSVWALCHPPRVKHMVFCLPWTPKCRVEPLVEPLVQDHERAFLEEIQKAERYMQKARDSVLDARHCISKVLDQCRDAQRDSDHWASRVYSPAQVRATEAAVLRLRVEVMTYIDVDATFRETDESQRNTVTRTACRLAVQRLQSVCDVDAFAGDETLWPAALTRRNIELVHERDSLRVRLAETQALLHASTERQKQCVRDSEALTKALATVTAEHRALVETNRTSEASLRKLEKDRTVLLAKLKEEKGVLLAATKKFEGEKGALLVAAKKLEADKDALLAAAKQLDVDKGMLLVEVDKLKEEKSALAARVNPSEECPITLAVMRQPLRTRCGHVFEASALWGVMKSNGRCPLCRRPIVID